MYIYIAMLDVFHLIIYASAWMLLLFLLVGTSGVPVNSTISKNAPGSREQPGSCTAAT